MKNVNFVLGIAWIVFLTTLAYASVGDLPSCEGKSYEYSLVITIFISVTLPFVLGYWAGKSKE